MSSTPRYTPSGGEIELVRQVAALREMVHGLTVRAAVTEAGFTFLAGRLIRAFPADLQRDLIAGLRESIAVSATAPDPTIAAWVALEGEERAAQMIDKIEAVVRSRAEEKRKS